MSTRERYTEGFVEEDEPSLRRHTDGKFRVTKNWMVAWILGTVLALVVGYGAGFLVRSPLDLAKQNSAVQLAATAMVTDYEFFPESNSATGVIQKGSVVNVPEFLLSDGETPVVTKHIANVGDTIASGQPVLYVAGHPIFVLNIPFPLYRDLKPGDAGQDVEALQQELARLGHYQDVVDGKYGSGMAASIRSLYESVNAPPPQALPELAGAVTEAQKALSAVEKEDAKHAGRQYSDETGPTTNTSGGGAQPSEAAVLRKELEAARRKADTPLPKFSIIAIPAKHVDVVTSPTVGTVMTDNQEALKLRSQGTSVTGRFSVLEEAGFETEDRVTVTAASDPETTATGSVASISEFKDADPEKNLPPGYDYVLGIGRDEESGFTDEQVVTVTTLANKLTGETARAVPVLAIRQDSISQYVYTVKDPATAADPETYTRVDIMPGQQQDGWVNIADTPLSEGVHLVLGLGK